MNTTKSLVNGRSSIHLPLSLFLSTSVLLWMFSYYYFDDAYCCHHDAVLRINKKISRQHFVMVAGPAVMMQRCSCCYSDKCHCSTLSTHSYARLTRRQIALCGPVYLFCYRYACCWHLSVSNDAPFVTHLHFMSSPDLLVSQCPTGCGGVKVFQSQTLLRTHSRTHDRWDAICCA